MVLFKNLTRKDTYFWNQRCMYVLSNNFDVFMTNNFLGQIKKKKNIESTTILSETDLSGPHGRYHNEMGSKNYKSLCNPTPSLKNYVCYSLETC